MTVVTKALIIQLHPTPFATMMKTVLASTIVGSAVAFAPTPIARANTAMRAFTIDNMPGALAPMGFFDPLGFAEKADEKTLKRYREAEVTHGRVAMLAVIGFFVGEAVEGSSFLFDGQITGPAISHFTQVPDGWDALIVTFIGAAEAQRAQIGWVDPANASYDQPGLLRGKTLYVYFFTLSQTLYVFLIVIKRSDRYCHR